MFTNNPEGYDELTIHNPTGGQLCDLQTGRCYKEIEIIVSNRLPDVI